MDFTKMCRTCLDVVTEPVSVTSNIYDFMENAIGLNMRLTNCPLCFECYRRLLSFKKFYTQCHDAEEFLKINLESTQKAGQEYAVENEEDIDEEGTISEKMYTTNQETHEVEICKTEILENEQLLLIDTPNKYLEDDEDTCNSTQKDSLTDKKSSKEIQAKDKKGYTCEYCGKTFAKHDNMRKHQKIHSNNKPFKCHICQRSFRQRNTLRNHEYIHSNYKPFKCDVCQQSFRQISTLRTHEALHNGKTVKCDKCNKLYARKSQLMRHIRVHLKDKRIIG